MVVEFDLDLRKLAPQDVTAVLFRLNGQSHPSLAATRDGALYVMKPHGFPGGRGLMNEVIGTEIARYLRLPVPPWDMLAMDEAFLSANPEIWYRAGATVIRPKAGIHFGSRLVTGKGSERVYQIIPSTWISRVVNREDFAGMLILDLWMNHCDRRQAVYVGTQQQLRAVFVDNDHILGGRFGSDETCARRAMTPDLATYRGIWQEETVERWIRRVRSIRGSWIRWLVSSVPEAWMEGIEPDFVVETLMLRQARLESLVDEVSTILKNSYSVKSTHAVGATRPMWMPHPA